MNAREFNKAERGPIGKSEFDAVLKKVLTTPVKELPKSQNREPTKTELNEHFRLSRTK